MARYLGERKDREATSRSNRAVSEWTIRGKGAGEGGTNAVGAALAAAIDDALRVPGTITQLPASPQTIKALLQN